MTIDKPQPAEERRDHERLHAWGDRLFAGAADLPVSFNHGGSGLRGIPQAWGPSSAVRTLTPAITETVYQAREPGGCLALRVEALRYHDFPVLEWTAWLRNVADRPSELITDLLGLDASFAGYPAALHHGNGDFCSPDSYRWDTAPLAATSPVELAPRGGRPCDGAFPYFRLLFPDGGLTIAVGWPGQWQARFVARDGSVSVQAGQERTRLRLQPGETIRTPRITLLAWDGEQDRAVNLWRRWYREHVMPRPGGRKLRPLLSLAATDEGEEFTGATETNQVAYQRRFAGNGVDYDVWWLDAGWYPCRDEAGVRRWPRTGTWRPDPERFPRGLGPVSAEASAHGAKLLVWFEPERVVAGTELSREHPEWILPPPNDQSTDSGQLVSGLLDLGNPACRAWLVELVSNFVVSQGVGIYRQDFNFAPLDYWRAHDPDDRQGMTENLHVQGYLAFWDELRHRYPEVLIDSCASGGRRNDLETMRRAVPLHYTDYGYGEHASKLDFHRALFEWLPYFRETSQSWDIEEARRAGIDAREGDSFAFHCALAPMLSPALNIRAAAVDFEQLGKMIGLWRLVADILLDGDYHSLTPPGRRGDEWVAWQFDRPEPDGSDGFVQAIRLSNCDNPRLTVHLRALEAASTYRFEEAETGEQRTATGADLVDAGFSFELPPRRGSIWLYRRIGVAN